MTREEWLLTAAHRLGELHSLPLPLLRVSCGFPSRKATGKLRAIGECWPIERTRDGVVQIFISPLLDDPAASSGVLATLLHELCHAADGCRSGHRGNFGVLARACGLEGKLTATHAGAELLERLNALTLSLGPYPHAAVDPISIRKQTTRLCKVVCPGCGYTARITRKWLEVGLPTCPCGSLMRG